MIRRLFWLFGLLLSWLVIRRIVLGSRRADARPGSPRFEGAMVRDRVCETFLPRSGALRLVQGGEEHFFCSEGCRSRFLASRSVAS
jgi:YHS domain-containing protein